MDVSKNVHNALMTVCPRRTEGIGQTLPLCTPELPQGSYQKVSLFQSLTVAPETGITLSSGRIKPKVRRAAKPIKSLLLAVMGYLLYRLRRPGPWQSSCVCWVDSCSVP